MLKNVHIKNLALIDEADINYEKGLNIMTGETGSGKSIIISSVNIALGDKANKSMIRRGCDHGLIELTFATDSSNVHSLLGELGIEDDGSTVTITRKITKDSSFNKVNGETITLANLKRITSLLVDIHGQHDHQSLLDQSNHISILDQFGHSAISGPKQDFRRRYDEYRSLKSEFSSFSMDEETLSKKIAFLEFEHKEIEDAALIPGEDEKLRAELKALETLEKESAALRSVLALLNDDERGVTAKIAQASSNIAGAASANPENAELKAFKDTITDIESITGDFGRALEKYVSEHGFDKERYDKVLKRLSLIDRLESKYGNSVEEVLKYYQNVQDEMAKLTDFRKNRAAISSRLAFLRGELNRAAGDLSNARKECAKTLEAAISDNLKDLNFLNVDFRIDIQKADRISGNGFDRVEFLISLNPGESVKPLTSVASGGELSRIMLAIKSSIAENDAIPTLIFDEIDTGISGRTAQMVAAKLRSLSSSHQIISITHLPQIAAMADTHFMIHKEVEDGTTISGIEKLDKDQRVIEIAKLLSGEEITTASLENARVLLNASSNK